MVVIYVRVLGLIVGVNTRRLMSTTSGHGAPLLLLEERSSTACREPTQRSQLLATTASLSSTTDFRHRMWKSTYSELRLWSWRELEL